MNKTEIELMNGLINYNSRKSLWGVEEMVTIGNNEVCCGYVCIRKWWR